MKIFEYKGSTVGGHIITLPVKKLNCLLGTGFTADELEKPLELSYFDVSIKNADELPVGVYDFRIDVDDTVDLIEEVGRIYKYCIFLDEIFDGGASGIMKDIDYVKENDYVKKMFFNYLIESGYELLDCVAVNSKIDSSVFLVGSCTNVFKPIFLGDRISDFGHFIIQPSINSKYVDCLYNDALERYSSNYITLGVLDKYDNFPRIMHTAFGFILKMFDAKSLSVKANSIDTDFTRIISRDYNEIKLILCGGDKCRNYFGTYNGLQICGRCIQFLHYNENTCYYECFANLSVYEYNGDCVGVEFSTTVAAINIERFNLKNTNEVNVLKSVSDNMNIKLLECISTVAILIKDGVRPNSSQMSGRIFKKYNRALAYLVEKQKISYEEVIKLIRKYVNLEFDTNIDKADEEIIGMVLKK